MTDALEFFRFLPWMLCAGYLSLRYLRLRDAKPVATRETVWRDLAHQNGWRFVPPLRIEAVVSDVAVTVRGGEWNDGGPCTRVEARLQDPSVAPATNEVLEALRATIVGLRATHEGEFFRLEWDRLEADPLLLEAAIRGLAEACRWEAPRVLYR